MKNTTIGGNLLDALAMLLVAGGILLAQSQPPPPAPGVIGKAKRDKGTNKNVVPDTDNQSPTRSAQSVSPPEAEKTKGESAKGTQSPVVLNINVPKSEFHVTDWLIMAFTGGLVGVGYLQWRILKGHHSVMKSQEGHIEGLLTQTKVAAEAAKESARIADLSLRITQRPVVLPDFFILKNISPGTNPIERFIHSFIVIGVKNVGASVAENFHYSIWFSSNGKDSKHGPKVSHPTALQPQKPVLDVSRKLGEMFDQPDVARGVIDGLLKVRGFIRYRSEIEHTGRYVGFSAEYDVSIDEFRITTNVAEDIGQSPS